MQPTVHFLPPDKWKEIPSVMDTCGIGSIIKKDDFVAIKLHFGEKGNTGYVKAKFIKPIIKKVRELGAFPFVTDANTIYKGARTDAVHHLMVAAEHEYHSKYLGCPVIIADGLRGNAFVEVELEHVRPSSFDRLTMSSGRACAQPKHFKKIKVAEAIYNADVILSVAHFKGHELCGVGGAIKNLGMGCSSKGGKYEQHNSVVPKLNVAKCTACGACVKWCGGNALTLDDSRGGALSPPAKGGHGGPPLRIQFNASKCTGCGQCILACNFGVFNIPWSDDAAIVQEKIAEYASGVLKNKRAFYINFLTFITARCDCFKTIHKPLMPDIGILLSNDPVAIDQACMDLIEKHTGRDILKEASGMDGNRQIEYAEELGLGKRKYESKGNE